MVSRRLGRTEESTSDNSLDDLATGSIVLRGDILDARIITDSVHEIDDVLPAGQGSAHV